MSARRGAEGAKTRAVVVGARKGGRDEGWGTRAPEGSIAGEGAGEDRTVGRGRDRAGEVIARARGVMLRVEGGKGTKVGGTGRLASSQPIAECAMARSSFDQSRI